MSPTGQYIVFQGHDVINNLYCLVGGYCRNFSVNPQTGYIPAVLPIWRERTYQEFVQTQVALRPIPTFTTTASGVAVFREAPVCAGKPHGYAGR
jgi:hypothetical protein